MATERADGADRFVHHGAAGIGLLLGDVSGIGGLDSAACNFLEVASISFMAVAT